MKKNWLVILNISLSIILFGVLLFWNIGDKFMYIMALTAVIGWFMPYLVLLITGITMYRNILQKCSLIFNFVSILLCIVIIYFVVKIIEKSFIIMIVEYSIIIIMNIINIIWIIKEIKNKIDKEYEEIKKIKKENNGIIK